MRKTSAKTNTPLTVLVVDDTPTWRQLLKSLLETELEIFPVVASSGQEALNILYSSPIDVVISDLNMPGMNGMQLLQRARLRHPRTKFIIMSADADTCQAASAEFIACGAMAAIPKDEIAPKLLTLLRKLEKSA